MSKKTVFTNLTPLPATVTRDTAVGLLHNHDEMIELNPLVIRHARSTAPPNATSEEVEHMMWYELTDEIQYLPGTPAKGEVTYKGGFYNLPRGLQTHVFAPAGVDIRAHWTIGGTMPGEEKDPIELGVNVPRDRLYLREDVDLRCNVFLTNFVKRNMKKSHGVLVERLVEKANWAEERQSLLSTLGSIKSSSTDSLQRDRVPVFSPTPSTSDPSTSYTSPNPPPEFHRTPSPMCTCESGVHITSCPWYPIRASRQPSAQRPSFGQPPPVAQHQIATPTTISTVSSASSCYCTGGVHDASCESYPGLRLPQQRVQLAPQHSQTSSYQQSHASTSKPLRPDLFMPTSESAGLFRPQQAGEHAELPGTTQLSPSDTEEIWSSVELKPAPLVMRSYGLTAVAVELDSNPRAAQQYYEYQGQRTK